MQITTMERIREVDEAIDRETQDFIGQLRPTTISHEDNSQRLVASAQKLGVDPGVFSSYVHVQMWARVVGETCEEYPDIRQIWKQVCPKTPFGIFEKYFHDRCRKIYQESFEWELSDQEEEISLSFYDDDEIFEDLQSDPDYLGH